MQTSGLRVIFIVLTLCQWTRWLYRECFFVDWFFFLNNYTQYFLSNLITEDNFTEHRIFWHLVSSTCILISSLPVGMTVHRVITPPALVLPLTKTESTKKKKIPGYSCYEFNISLVRLLWSCHGNCVCWNPFLWYNIGIDGDFYWDP